MAGYEVGSAFLTVMPSAKGFAGSLGKQLDGPFMAAGERGGQKIGDGVGRGGKKGFVAAGAGLGKVFAGAFIALGGIEVVRGVTDYLSSAIDSASSLEQSIGGVDAVFKGSAGQIHAWAQEAADAVGLSRNEFNELATVIGAQLKNMGVPLEDVAVQTNTLVGIGADLAAQFGGSTSDAVSALSSLLRGERDPIERYGVSINDAAIKAKMAEMGLEGLTGEADKSARTQATLALLTQQTADATGAFARESDTLAGKQQRLQAEMENVKTEIGTALMPVATELFTMFRDVGVPMLQDLADWFTENQDGIMEFAFATIDGTLLMIQSFLGLMEHMARMQSFWIMVATNMIQTWLNVAEGIINGAVTMFGWVPGVGDKLREVQTSFGQLRDDADRKFSAVRAAADTTTQAFEDGQGAVQGLRDRLGELKDKTVRLTLVEEVRRSGGGVVDGYYVTPRADGGPVRSGRPYLVGEREAELFVPDRNGQIYNQRQLAAMGTGGDSGSASLTYLAPESVEAVAEAVLAGSRNVSVGMLRTAGRRY